jgi:lipoprotein-anchoring transpeptidase ErfK/SrfK
MKEIPAAFIRGLHKNVLASVLLVLVIALSGAGSTYAESAMSGSASPSAAGAKWIDVDLSSQTLRAYQGRSVVYTTRISSGTSKYPTVQGTFYIYSKVRSQRMRGGRGADAYDLPNVPHVMYFYQAYAIHGTYWHNNFGRPMSHGCVNANQKAAAWLYNWTPMGTKVVVHW